MDCHVDGYNTRIWCIVFADNIGIDVITQGGNVFVVDNTVCDWC